MSSAEHSQFSLVQKKASNDSLLTIVDILPLNSRDLFEMNENIVFVASMTLNVLLAAILLTEQSKFLKAYTRVLMQNCICDIFYTIILFACKIECEYYDGRLVILSAGFYRTFSLGWHYFGFAAYVFAVLLSMFVIPIVFYFRYCLVVKNVHLTERRLFAILCFLMVWVFILTSFMISAMLGYDKDREETCRQVFTHPMWTYDGHDISNCITTEAGNPQLLVYYALIAVSNITMYGTMFFCTRAVFATLKEAKANLQEKTAKLQKQMNMLLIVQLTTPILCASLPLTLAAISCLLRLTLPGLGMLVLFAFAWIPLINPCITILLVSNYRRKSIKILTAPFRQFFDKSSSSVFPSANTNTSSTGSVIA